MCKATWRWLMCIALAALALTAPRGSVVAQTPSTEPIRVYYAGPEDAVAQAIDRATPYLTRVNQTAAAQVLVINNAPLADLSVDLGGRVRSGDLALVLFCGPSFPTEPAQLLPFMGVSAFGLTTTSEPTEARVNAVADPLQTSVAWRSAPLVQSRTVMSNPNMLQPVIETRSGAPLIQRMRSRYETQVFIVGLWLNAAQNVEWLQWPYFDYLVYWLIVSSLEGHTPVAYDDYPLAPVPQGRARAWLIGNAMGLAVVTLLAVVWMRRYLYFHMQALFLRRDALPPPRLPAAEWETAGFQHPLSGFLAWLSAGSLLLLPYLYQQIYLLPEALFPWGQTRSFGELAARWLALAWALLDGGMGLTTVRYFAALRVRYPQEAFRGVQVYVWWQWVSGALQLIVVTGLAIFYFPMQGWSHLAYYFIGYSVLRFPGFLLVFKLLFQALHSHVTAQRLGMLAIAGPFFLQPLLVAGMRYWSSFHPGISEELASLWGIALGTYVTQWLVFGVGAWFYWRAGFSFTPVWMPAFRRETMARMARFGAQVALGDLAAPLAALLQLWVFTGPAWSAYGPDAFVWRAASVWMALYGVLGQGLYASLMPALTEVHTKGYVILLRYLVGRGIHVGVWFSFFVAACSAVSAPITLGLLGAEYALAARLTAPFLLGGALCCLDWSAQCVLLATDHPLVRSLLIWFEAAARVGLLAALLPRWSYAGLLAAYLLPLLSKILIAWLFVRASIVKPRVEVWRSFVAPLGAALLLYRSLALVAGAVGTPSLMGSGALLAALVAGLLLYSFISAWLGAWDSAGIRELRYAARLCGAFNVLAWGVYGASALGLRFSFVRQWPAAPLATMAAEEAWALTLARPPLE